MKYNQYAYVETDFDQQVKELIDINFLPKNYADWNFNDLLGKDAPVIDGLKGLLPCYRPGDGLRRKAASPSGQSEQHAHNTQKMFPHTRPPACGPSL